MAREDDEKITMEKVTSTYTIEELNNFIVRLENSINRQKELLKMCKYYLNMSSSL
jgi:flagellar biosynthesis chaperone FliJ